jgi:hypothetical protein
MKGKKTEEKEKHRRFRKKDRCRECVKMKGEKTEEKEKHRIFRKKERQIDGKNLN